MSSDVDVVLVGRGQRFGVYVGAAIVDDLHSRCSRENLPRTVLAQRVLQRQVDRLAVRAQNRHAHCESIMRLMLLTGLGILITSGCYSSIDDVGGPFTDASGRIVETSAGDNLITIRVPGMT